VLKVICQVCNRRPAASHLLKLDPPDGSLRELHICTACQTEHDLYLRSAPPPIAEFLAATAKECSGTGRAGLHIDLVLHEGDEGPECEVCGLSWSDFAHSIRFGCDACAGHFAPRLDPELYGIHGAREHVGRLPSLADQERRHGHIARRMHLKRQLAKAVAEEAFERAARLRDELRHLDGGPA